MVGPLIGGSLNTLIGYLACFLIFAGLLAITGVVSVLLLPKSLNAKPEISKKEYDRMSASIAPSKQVKNSMFFKNRRCMFALCSCAILSLFVNFKQAFLTIVLTDP